MIEAQLTALSGTRTQVYILDDDAGFQRILNRQLQTEYNVLCFGEASQFLEVAASLAPGCLILDLHMPKLNGVQVQRALNNRNIHFPIIMMSGQGELHIAVEAMKAGAVDFLEKPFPAQALLESLRAASRRLGAEQKPQCTKAAERLAALTRREFDVLGQLVAGWSNKIIAHQLGLSPRTVEMHRANIMRKTEAGSLSTLVRLAVAAGLSEQAPAGSA